MIELLQRLDERLFRFINHTLANPIGDWFFPSFNHAAPYFPLLMIIIGWLAYSHSPRLWLLTLILIIGVALGDTLIFNPLKEWVSRPRPAVSLEGVRTLASGATGGHSFPSSHTANAFLVAAILCSFFPKKRGLILIIASCIGFARIYVGVHYPSDILGSILLGWYFGKAYLWIGQRAWQQLSPYLVSPRGWKVHSLLSPQSLTISKKEEKENVRFRILNWLPWLALAGIQFARLLWAATTDLDVPPEAARLWCLATNPSSTTFSFTVELAKLWFRVFGSSPLSFWAIPWTLQTIWLIIISYFSWSEIPSNNPSKTCNKGSQNGSITLWALLLLTIIVPMISQLSFLGSPEQIFSDSNWTTSRNVQALIFYTLLTAPLWIAVLFQACSHPIASFSTALGWTLACSFPSLPWYLPMWMSSGTFIFLAKRIGKQLPKLSEPASRWWRSALALFGLYGIIVSAAVYQPHLLRKLNFSLLPRNTPHYVQTGWREWSNQIRPALTALPTRIIWTDSPLSRDQVQYWLGRSFEVHDPPTLSETPPKIGVLYIRETYFEQINPRVIFLDRRSKAPLELRLRMQEIKIPSTAIFRKGDPIRQFQLNFIPSS